MIDAKRAQVGMASIALSKPDDASHYLNCQVEHIEIAGPGPGGVRRQED